MLQGGDPTGIVDTVTETTHVGFFQKLANSLVGLILGPILVAASVWGLFWNEGRAVTTARSLTEGAGQVLTVDAARVVPENQGKLIHVVGSLKTTAPLVDPEFAVSVQGAILSRAVEMYQWKEDSRTETKKNLGGSEDRVTTYSYTRQWSTGRIDSSRFKQAADHRNPELLYKARTVVAKDATLGAFRPGESTISLLGARDGLPIEPSQAAAIQARVSTGKVSVVDGAVYIGNDPALPAIGDVRITFKVARPETITVIGAQAGTDFAAYPTKAGDKLLFARPGAVAAADIFAGAQADNRMWTWILRAVGAIVMLIGFAMLSAPLVALGDVVPFIGSLIGTIGSVIALILTAILAPTVIAVAWMWYRPLISIAVLGAGLALAFLVRRFAPARKAALAAKPA